MKSLTMYYATVTNNEDEDTKGKVQVRILPEFKDIKESMLPWASPFYSTGFSTTSQSMSIPEIGSKLYILADEKFRKFYYLQGAYVDGLFDWGAIDTALDAVTELSDKTYPSVDFTLLNDGSIRFNNRDTGDIGFLHNTGTYFIIDTDGYITVSEVSGNIVKLNSDGISIVDSNGNTITLSSTGMVIDDSNGNSIDMGTTSVKINGNLEILNS